MDWSEYKWRLEFQSLFTGKWVVRRYFRYKWQAILWNMYHGMKYEIMYGRIGEDWER